MTNNIKIDDKYFIENSGGYLYGPYTVIEIKKSVFKLSNNSSFMLDRNHRQYGTANSFLGSHAVQYSKERLRVKNSQQARVRLIAKREKVIKRLSFLTNVRNAESFEKLDKLFDEILLIERVR